MVVKTGFGIWDSGYGRGGRRRKLGHAWIDLMPGVTPEQTGAGTRVNPESRPSTAERLVIPNPGHAQRAGGFTLLEMLAVIALLGIIAVAVITTVLPRFDKGKYKTGKIQLNTLSQDIDNYILDNGSPPQQLLDLVKKPVNGPNWQGPYAKESQLKDPYGHDVGYQYPGQHGKYDLIFFGEDGKPGGERLNADAGN